MTLRDRLIALAAASQMCPPEVARTIAIAAARMALEEVTNRKYPCWRLNGWATLSDTMQAIRALRDGLE